MSKSTALLADSLDTLGEAIIKNDEVIFKKTYLEDIEAHELGVKGYPTTVIFKDGRYMGHIEGAITLQQLGEALNQANKRNKNKIKSDNYMSDIKRRALQTRLRDL